MALRVLVVSQLFYPDTVGGSERVIYEQARGLARRSHAVTVVVQRARRELPPEETIDGIRVLRYGTARRRWWFGMSHTDLTAGRRALARLLAAERFDVVALHHPFPAAAYFRARGKNVAPVLYVFHASVYRELQFQASKGRPIARSVLGMAAGALAGPLLLRRVRRTERQAISASQRVAVLSAFSKKLVMDTYGVPESGIAMIPGGVDLDAYRPSPSPRAVRSRLGLPQDRAIVLTVRRLVARMGLEELLAAAERLLRGQPDFQLVIGGAGEERERLVATARKLGIAHAVTFLGYVAPRDLPDYLAAADLFVMPTVAFEGFGIATIEALASGTPVLGTPVGAIPEILSALDPSLITADATPEALAEGIRGFLARPPEAREELRRKARALAEERYPWSRSVDLLESELIRLAAMMQPIAPNP